MLRKKQETNQKTAKCEQERKLSPAAQLAAVRRRGRISQQQSEQHAFPKLEWKHSSAVERRAAIGFNFESEVISNAVRTLPNFR